MINFWYSRYVSRRTALFHLLGYSSSPKRPRIEEINRPENESRNEPRYAAKVVEQRTALASEEPVIAHDVQVKERREHSKEADSQYGSVSRNCMGEAMGEPIQYLGQAGNGQNHDQVSKQPRPKAESVLLHARIHPGGERYIADLYQNDGQGAVSAGVGHRRNVNE